MEDNVDDALEMLRQVIEGFYYEGNMPIQHAYARTVLATELISTALGFDSNLKLVNSFNQNKNCHLVLFPEDRVLDNHISKLTELKEDLAEATGHRNTLMFIGKDDEGKRHSHHLRLIKSEKE